MNFTSQCENSQYSQQMNTNHEQETTSAVTFLTIFSECAVNYSPDLTKDVEYISLLWHTNI